MLYYKKEVVGMTSVKNVYKKIIRSKKALLSLSFIGILLLILGIKSTYAYYHSSNIR